MVRPFLTITTALACTTALLPGCETPPDENAEAVAAMGPTQLIALSGVQFQVPTSWTISSEATETRVLQMTVPAGPDDDEQDAQLSVYYFGADGAGPVASNIARWCNQIEMPDPSRTDARPMVEKRTVNEIDLHTVDASGTYVAETFPGSGEFENRPDQRLLAAIVMTDAGPYYIKVLGPRLTMRRWVDEWDGVLSSVEAAPVTDTAVVVHP